MMNLNCSLLEIAQICAGVLPVNLSAGANTGDWVSLKNFERCLVILFKDAGTAGDDPTLTLQQAQDVSDTGVKELNFTTIFKKQGADVRAVGQWTKVTQATGNTYTDATSAEVEAIWAVDIKAEDLDVANGFDCIRASVADTDPDGSNAQLGCLLYIPYGCRYPGAPEDVPSAISN